MKIQVKKKKKPKSKANPMLIRVNPPGEIDELWGKASSMQPSLTKAEFLKAVEQFRGQHGTLPQNMTMEDIPGVANDVKVLIKVGDVEQIHYTPDKYSRKAPHTYYHETKKESLLTDADGKVLIMKGKTKLSNSGWTKGWLVD